MPLPGLPFRPSATAARLVGLALVSSSALVLAAPLTAATAAPRAAASAAAGLVPVARINAGGPTVAVGGRVWQADHAFTGGKASTATPSGDVAGTKDDLLYRDRRYGTFRYSVPVPTPGDYVVRLHFAENTHRAPGKRIFSVDLEGRARAVRDLDLVRRAGRMRALVTEHVVAVSDGRLSLTATATADHALLSAMEVLHRPRAVASTGLAPAVRRRDVTLQPFASTSVWNLPIGTGARFESATDPRTANLIGAGGLWANEGQYSHPVTRATTNDPLAVMTDTTDASRSGTYRIPSTATIAAGSDAHMHIISADGRTVDEAWAVVRRSPTSYTTGRHHSVDLNGSGIGPRNGTRAYGGSAIGGLIRAWEVDPTHPKYTGVIKHPIAIALRNDQLLHTGGGVGYNPDGTMMQSGYVWPATEQDWDSPWTYSGKIPMGTYLAIPSTVDLTTLGLTPQGLMLARAYQDYGAYVTDRAGDMILAYVEPSPAGSAFTNPLFGPNWSAADLKKIRTHLRIVTNNTPRTPNATTLTGPRRAPLLP